jgi:hypothetical protein
MSLGRLLTSGKSLIGLKDLDNRYRMRQGARLPKFGSPRNPFLAKTDTAATGPASQADPAEPGPTPAERAAAKLKDTRRLPTISLLTGAAMDSKLGWFAKLAAWAGALAGRVAPRSWRQHAQAMPKAATAVSSIPAPVQGELSLDRVKVVRNDLNDADVEVVPAKAPTREQPASGEKTKETGELVSMEAR